MADDSILDCVIVGGGPTGVELAGALAEIARRLGASVYLSLHIDSAPNPLARSIASPSPGTPGSACSAHRCGSFATGFGSMMMCPASS